MKHELVACDRFQNVQHFLCIIASQFCDKHFIEFVVKCPLIVYILLHIKEPLGMKSTRTRWKLYWFSLKIPASWIKYSSMILLVLLNERAWCVCECYCHLIIMTAICHQKYICTLEVLQSSRVSIHFPVFIPWWISFL